MTANSSAHSERPGATLPFFAAAYGITWSLQLPATLAYLGYLDGPLEPLMLVGGLGAFGPSLAAIAVARYEAGAAGVRALLRLRAKDVAAIWYLIALALPSLTFWAGMAFYMLLGNTDGAWLYPPDNAQRMIALVVFPIGEELGWRGFALPRLQKRYGALNASLLIGVAWAAWHIPMYVLAGGWSVDAFLMSTVLMTAASVRFTWLYNRTGGSLLPAILMHAGGHLNNYSRLVSGSPRFGLILAPVSCLLALTFVLGDRKSWRRLD